QASQEMGLQQVLQKPALKRLEIFFDMISEKQKLIDEQPMKAIRSLVEDIDYESWLQEQSSNPKAAQFRIENVNYLLNNIETMLQRDEDKDLRAVIAKLILFDLLEQQEQEDDRSEERRV